MQRLIIKHLPGSESAGGDERFVVTRATDHRDSDPVTVCSPASRPVAGQPDGDLATELSWYLEGFLEYPFPPWTQRADRLREALQQWGRDAFVALFGSGRARVFYHDATRDEGLAGLCLEVRSDDPRVLSWPWEALEDAEAAPLGPSCQVERRLNAVADPPAPGALPTDRVNILLLIARPFKTDVGFRSIARPLVELIDSQHLPAHVTLVRPPTFERLQEILEANPDTFHILHFDGHGGYGTTTAPAAASAHRLQGPQGRLVFETTDGEPDPVDATTLGTLLRDHRLPAVVLNACQSAKIDHRADDAFASVAAALLKAGVRSVVAMAYSLYVSGAQHFLPAFYRTLFEHGDMGRATRAGRRKMFEKPGRVCSRGTFDLQDWLVPVLYQQSRLDLSFATTARAPHETQAPPAALDPDNPHGLIGRDSALLALERAMRRKPAAILVHGLGGVGKTTLARGLLHWLHQTSGLEAGAMWLDFRDIRSAESVINQLLIPLLGPNALTAPLANKVDAVAQGLRQLPLVLVWDNFESARGTEGSVGGPLLPPADLDLLRTLLDRLRGGRTTVLITSRSHEPWLPPTTCFKLHLGGLHGEERWELCKAILDDFGFRTDWNDPGLTQLMETLEGHPLMMRAVLPHLAAGTTATTIEHAVRTNLATLTTTPDPLHTKILATLRFVEQSLPAHLRPLLTPLSLHHRFAATFDIEAMGKQVEGDWNRTRIDELFTTLTTAGLTTQVRQGIYSLHPALTGFLHSTDPPTNHRAAWERAFVDHLGRLADHYAPLQLHEQRDVFAIHEANFHHALALAQTHDMDTHVRALTQSLASYALNTRALDEAERLFEQLADFMLQAGDASGEAAAYHQLGIIAEERRDFDNAESWYLKALAIKEKQGNEHGAACSYHQLGRIAEERRDLDNAEMWYFKSLAIKEKLGNEHGAATSYHQLGNIAQERRDLDNAEMWYLKALAIKEKQGDEHGTATSYHQLGIVAQKRHDLDNAESWYRKSLAIEERQGNEHGAATSYGQLGTVALMRRDLNKAEEWHLKSLAIFEKQGNEHGAAASCHQLGVLSLLRGDHEAAAGWLVNAARLFARTRSPHNLAKAARTSTLNLEQAPEALRAHLRQQWTEAGLPPLEELANTTDEP